MGHERDPMEDLASLVDSSLEVVFRATYPDTESAELKRDKRVQVLVRHLNDPAKTYAVLGTDVRDALKRAYGTRTTAHP